MSLITTNEVIKHSFAERNFPPDKISRLLEIVENRFMRNCFGVEFYDTLKDDVVDWSEIEEWEAGSYSIGDLVFWEDDVFQSTHNTNTEEPSLVATKWKLADKFDTDEYDNLYKLYLRPILANEIVRIAVPLETVKFTAKGAVIQTDDSANTLGADSATLDSAMRHTKELIEIMKSEMIEYVKSQQEKYDTNPATGFNYKEKKVAFLDCSSCNVTTKQGRRIAFKH